MRIGPVTFLLLVPALWAGVRALLLWPEARADATPPVAWADPLPHKALVPSEVARRNSPGRVQSVPRRSAVRFAADERLARISGENLDLNAPAASEEVGTNAAEHSQGFSVSPTINRSGRSNALSLSAWALIRGDVSPGLAAGGQLGGSQAGVRARYRLAGGLYLAARLSGPLQSRLGKEAALALDLRPLPSVPITLSVERRIGLDGGGRDAFGIGAFGGFDREFAPGLSLDGYGQAGLVGLKRRDAYFDGALRAEREIVGAGKLRIGLGAGAWGGAQPGAARLDVGPQIVAHLPVFDGGVRLGAEWRQRVAGRARPNSGPVLSLGANF